MQHFPSTRSGGAIEPKFYAAADQNTGAFSFEIRTIGDPDRVVNLVRRSLLGADENLSITDLQTLDQKIDTQNAQSKVIADLSAIFGVIALFLAAIGIYATISYIVARRINARVLAAQLYGANATGPRWSLARYEHVDSATQLDGINAMDLPTITVTICILVASALIAAYIPAARAARVDPASALRQE